MATLVRIAQHVLRPAGGAAVGSRLYTWGFDIDSGIPGWGPVPQGEAAQKMPGRTNRLVVFEDLKELYA